MSKVTIVTKVSQVICFGTVLSDLKLRSSSITFLEKYVLFFFSQKEKGDGSN